MNFWKKLAWLMAKKPVRYWHDAGLCAGPFIVGMAPPGEFNKDWSTDADDIWFKDGWFVMYYKDKQND